MSVLQVRGRTTNSEEDFNAFALSSNSCIFTNAEENNVEEFSIELTLGEGWNDSYSESDKNLRRINGAIAIRGHGSIVVEVQEEIRVPHNRYGIVLPTGSLFLSRGIIIAPAKVELAFIGKLKLRMYNTTNQKISLEKGSKLGSVIFFSTESTKMHNYTYRKSEISAPPVSRLDELKKWLATNKAIWIGWIVSVISSSLIAFLLAYWLYYLPMLEMQRKQDVPAGSSTQETVGREEKK